MGFDPRDPCLRWLEVLDRADGGDGARESDVGEAVGQSGDAGSLRVAHPGGRRGPWGRGVADRGEGTQQQEFSSRTAMPAPLRAFILGLPRSHSNIRWALRLGVTGFRWPHDLS